MEYNPAHAGLLNMALWNEVLFDIPAFLIKLGAVQKTCFGDQNRMGVGSYFMKKLSRALPLLGIGWFSWMDCQAQSAFQNLDFEDAHPVIISSDNPNFVTTVSGLPNWTVANNGVPESVAIYNGISTGATIMTLVGAADPYLQPVDGAYSAVIQGIVPGSSLSLSQTGFIPAGAQTLFFDAEAVFVNPLGAEPLKLSVAGQNLTFVPVSVGPNYTLYGANISAWAGQTEPLTFTVKGGNYSSWELDDVSFSNVALSPEPSPLVLMGAGGIVIRFMCGIRKK